MELLGLESVPPWDAGTDGSGPIHPTTMPALRSHVLMAGPNAHYPQNTANVYLFIFIYLKGKARVRAREIFHPLAYFLNAFSSRGWATPKPASDQGLYVGLLCGHQGPKHNSQLLIRRKQSGLTGTPIWGVDIPSGGFTCCTTMLPAPPAKILLQGENQSARERDADKQSRAFCIIFSK